MTLPRPMIAYWRMDSVHAEIAMRIFGAFD